MGIDQKMFHTKWKIGKITPIPKIQNATAPDKFRPVTVLPVLSKIYELLIAKQTCEYIEDNDIYKPRMSGFRKHHSTATLLMKIKDDIIRAMNRGKVTPAMFVDYSKAFDTVNYKTLLTKLRHIWFSYDASSFRILVTKNNLCKWTKKNHLKKR